MKSNRTASHLMKGDQSMDGSKYPQPVWYQASDKRKRTIWIEAFVETARNFCYTTVLHGVKYLAEPRRSYFERLTWSMVLLALFVIATHMIWTNFIADLQNPLIINLESSNYPIWNFKFPAVTICPNVKLNRTLATDWAKSMKLPPGMNVEDLVDLVPNLLHLIEFSQSPDVLQLEKVLEKNEVKADELYLNLSVPCRHLLKQCRLQGRLIPCENLFKTMRTTEGYCCSFNYFGVSSQYSLNRYHVRSDETPSSAWRTASSGMKSGISVIVRTTGDFYGSLLSSRGVKVLLHVASNYPDHLSIARLVQPGHSEHFALSPTLIKAGADIRDIPPTRRGCIFYDERKLEGFEEYAYKNCMFNCRLQFFTELCGCIPFYYPVIQDGIRTCTLKDVPCLSKFKYEIQALRMNLSVNLSTEETPPCDCKPQCNELSYAAATSTYIMHNSLKTAMYKDLEDLREYAEVNVYFKALFGTLYQRVLPSTTYQMLANFGGLLGLFMGFSFTSAFEIIYSFSLRILFHVYAASKRRGVDSVQAPVMTVVQPFDK